MRERARIAVLPTAPAIRAQLSGKVSHASQPKDLLKGQGATMTAHGQDVALIRIEDTGPGIPAALLPKVCEPFVRGEDSCSTESGPVHRPGCLP